MKALILRSYGVGNAPQNKAFLQELQEASDRGIVVVNLTQCMSGKVNMGGYATGNALAHAGVIGGADMTVEATLTKLHYLLSQELDTQTIRKAMSQNLRGELTPDDRGTAMSPRALLLVDLQNDFCAGGALAVPEGDSTVDVANRLIDWCQSRGEAVIASQDWHPANHGSFASQHGVEPYTPGQLDGLPQTLLARSLCAEQ